MMQLVGDYWYLHQPKTGGSSVEQFFRDKNLVLNEYRGTTESKQMYGGYECFEGWKQTIKRPVIKPGTVLTSYRNPFDWYRSWFFYFSFRLYNGHPIRSSKSTLWLATKAGADDNYNFTTFLEYLTEHNYPGYTKAYEFFVMYSDIAFRLEHIVEDLSNFLVDAYGEDFNVGEDLKLINPTVSPYRKETYELSEYDINLIKNLDSTFFNK